MEAQLMWRDCANAVSPRASLQLLHQFDDQVLS
jgi:hypothetical protein